MTRSTEHLVYRVKDLTIALGKSQKLKSKYMRLLGKWSEDTPQYKDIQNEIKKISYDILSYKKELLAIKCAALTNRSGLSKSAKKAGFVTNNAYKDYLLDQFILEAVELDDRNFYSDRKDLEESLIDLLEHHIRIIRQLNIDDEKRSKSLLPDDYVEADERYYNAPINYFNTFGFETVDAEVVDRKIR